MSTLTIKNKKIIILTMIKFVTFRLLRFSLKNTLPKISSKLYNKIFTYSYRFFYYLKPSQIWIIILALLNKTEFKKLVSIPSMFILFSSIFSDSESLDSKLDKNILQAKLEANKLTDPENNWENFFWIIIVLAILKRFITIIFKLLWIPFKIALSYYILKYFGFDLSFITNLFNILNNLSLGVIDWFYNKIISFFNKFNHNDNPNN